MSNQTEQVNNYASEFLALDGQLGYNPETGASIPGGGSSLSSLTNRLFGCPYQLLPQVDSRLDDLNTHTGNEFLRNFLLHSPILYLRPGMPIYTGGEKGIGDSLASMYKNTQGGMGFFDSAINEILKNTVFSSGSKVQKRMFGFRETYLQYMQYANYMCRTVANLMDFDDLPNGTFVTGESGGSPSFTPFSDIRWENYRMNIDTYVDSMWEKATNLWGALTDQFDVSGAFNQPNAATYNQMNSGDTSAYKVIANSVTCVMFMVEPVAFNESITNNVERSFIENAIDGINNTLGSEIAFITGSNVDGGILEGMVEFLGNTTGDALLNLSSLITPLTGGFLSNLFTGAIRSLKGQKMIYPDIYKSSNTSMDYEFNVKLSSPYGDDYNYYMNIVVPLMHLIALAAPRLITSNSIASPFLVQTYIPGMCSCQLGIISQMSISKNPEAKHVSVRGFPLSVKVSFTVKELYNALSISPANDPASFLYNETLTDYLTTTAGLIPSLDSQAKAQASGLQQTKNFFDGGGSGDNALQSLLGEQFNAGTESLLGLFGGT